MACSKVLKNVVALRGYLQSMDCAIGKAERGSTVEDMYFLEKLHKMCNRMELVAIPSIHRSGADKLDEDFICDGECGVCEKTVCPDN